MSQPMTQTNEHKKELTADQQNLVSDNVRLVYMMMTKKFRYSFPGGVGSHAWEDGVSAGMDGLCNAAITFKHGVEYTDGKSVKFSSWACRLICQSIVNHLCASKKCGFRLAPPVVRQPSSLEDHCSNRKQSMFRDTLTARPEAEPEFEGKEVREKLEWAIQQLPFRERAILREIFYAGLNSREIATKLNVSKQWIQILRQQAIDRLKELMA
jgi:RNA polymerase sigma factor (sigma-70 family)